MRLIHNEAHNEVALLTSLAACTTFFFFLLKATFAFLLLPLLPFLLWFSLLLNPAPHCGWHRHGTCVTEGLSELASRAKKRRSHMELPGAAPS